MIKCKVGTESESCGPLCDYPKSSTPSVAGQFFQGSVPCPVSPLYVSNLNYCFCTSTLKYLYAIGEAPYNNGATAYNC